MRRGNISCQTSIATILETILVWHQISWVKENLKVNMFKSNVIICHCYFTKIIFLKKPSFLFYFQQLKHFLSWSSKCYFHVFFRKKTFYPHIENVSFFFKITPWNFQNLQTFLNKPLNKEFNFMFNFGFITLDFHHFWCIGYLLWIAH